MSARNEGSVDPHHSAPLATSLIRCPAPRCRQGTQIRPTRSKPAKGRRTRRVQLFSHTFWQVDQVRDNIPQQHPCLPSSAPSMGRKNLAYVKGSTSKPRLHPAGLVRFSLSCAKSGVSANIPAPYSMCLQISPTGSQQQRTCDPLLREHVRRWWMPGSPQGGTYGSDVVALNLRSSTSLWFLNSRFLEHTIAKS